MWGTFCQDFFLTAQQTNSYTTKKLHLKQPWKYSNVSETGFQVSQLAFSFSFQNINNTAKVGHIPNNARLAQMYNMDVMSVCVNEIIIILINRVNYLKIFIFNKQMLLSKTMMKYLLAWPKCHAKKGQIIQFWLCKQIYLYLV